MAKNYNYGFAFSESGGRKIIRYRQDKLWFASGLAWWVFFQLIALFFLLGGDGTYTWVLPFVALGALAYFRSRMREISVGEKDIIVKGKSYDRAKITQVFVENNAVRQTYSQAQDYDQWRETPSAILLAVIPCWPKRGRWQVISQRALP